MLFGERGTARRQQTASVVAVHLAQTPESTRGMSVSLATSGAPVYSVSRRAYSLILLHAAKYPAAAVNGLLIGRRAANNVVEVIDAFPLFHTHTLTPMLEAACMLVEEHCRLKAEEDGDGGGGGGGDGGDDGLPPPPSPDVLCIVGFYHANARLEDKALPLVVQQIGAQIQSNFAEGCVFLLDNEALGDEKRSGLMLFTQKATKGGGKRGKFKKGGGGGGGTEWVQAADAAGRVQVENGSMNAVTQYLREQGPTGVRIVDRLVDFDDHLNDTTMDWFNTDLLPASS